MRVKVLHVLTVCFIAFVVFSPVFAVFGLIWERHLDLVQTHQATCPFARHTEAILDSPLRSGSPAKAQSGGLLSGSMISIQSGETSFKSLSSPTSPIHLANILLGLILFAPVMICLGFSIQDWYLAYRTATLKKHVATLEKLWHQGLQH